MAILLIVTAALKFNSLEQNAKLAREPDVVFNFVNKGSLHKVTCVLEVVVAILILINTTPRQKAITLLTIAFLFLSYRIGLYYVGYSGPCSCLGIVNPFGLSTTTVTRLSDTMLFLMLIFPLFHFFTIRHEQ